MWIFTNKGFVSIVRHNQKPDCLLVRARDPQALHSLFPESDIEKTPSADYRYRTVLPAHQVAESIRLMVEGIDYPNFKDSIPPDRHIYHEACMHTWQIMYDYQRKSK